MEKLYFLLPIGKYFAASLALIVFYLLLFRDQSSYRSSRLYLLSITFVAWAIALPEFTVYTPEPLVVEREFVQSNVASSSVTALKSSDFSEQLHAESNSLVEIESNDSFRLSYLLGWIYVGVTSLLLLILLVQWIGLLFLRRKGVCVRESDLNIVTTPDVKTPFSFGKTIFVNPRIKEQKLKLILEHERWHIRHRHYMDVFIAEISVRLFWFNPCLWWVRHELRNIHEYEADRSLLDHGQEMYAYQTLILEEVMDSSPILANGFNGSFIKKRFIKMKSQSSIRRASLRKVVLVPFVLTMFCLFSFSIGDAPIIYKHKPIDTITSMSVYERVGSIVSNTVTAAQQNTKDFDSLVDKHVPVDTKTVELLQKTVVNMTESMLGSLPAVVRKDVSQKYNSTHIDHDTITAFHEDGSSERLIRGYTISDNGRDKQTYYRRFSPKVSDLPSEVIQPKYKFTISHNPNIRQDLLVSQLLSVQNNSDMTIVTIAVPVPEHGQMIRFSSQYLLIDRDQPSNPYQIRGLSGGYPLNEELSLSGYGGKFIEFKVIFPPIHSSVKEIDLTEPSSVDPFGHLTRFRNINLKQLRNQKKAQVIR